MSVFLINLRYTSRDVGFMAILNVKFQLISRVFVVSIYFPFDIVAC